MPPAGTIAINTTNAPTLLASPRRGEAALSSAFQRGTAVQFPRRKSLPLAAGAAAHAIQMAVGAMSPSQAQTPQSRQPSPAATHEFNAAVENSTFEWFFLLVDAGKEQGIWAKHGLE